jgi:hypothetical protein
MRAKVVEMAEDDDSEAPAGKSSHSERVRPLLATELAAVEGVGQRLSSELARLVRWIPAHSRSVRTMAAFLDVDRNTCQRIIAAVHPSVGGMEAFIRLPGVKPLRGVVVQARARRAPAELVAGLVAALDQLESVTRQRGESLARLKARVESALAVGSQEQARAGGGVGAVGELAQRRSLFLEHAQLLGRRMRASCLVTAIGPHADDPAMVEQAWVRGMVGVRLQPGGAPLSLGIASTDRGRAAQGGLATFNPLGQRAGKGERTAALVPELSSAPLPTMTTRGPAGSLVTVLDPVAAGGDEMDVAFATRISHVQHPTLASPEVFHTSSVMLTPTARLVFDVYLHRSLAIASVPACGAFQYTMSMSDDIGENWPFRLPGTYRLSLLGAGLGQAGCEAWEGHAAATRYLFGQTGWRADDYVGHRLDVEYPLWGSSLYQWFDFRSAAEPQAAGFQAAGPHEGPRGGP